MRFLVFSSMLVALIGVSTSADVASFLKHLEVIPDVISEAPKEFLTVST